MSLFIVIGVLILLSGLATLSLTNDDRLKNIPEVRMRLAWAYVIQCLAAGLCLAGAVFPQI